MRNREVARALFEIADSLEIKGIRFKPRAYRRAAQTIKTLPEDIVSIYERKELEQIPGIGSGIASKIRELLETGKLEYLEKLRKELPRSLTELMRVEGIGPRTALALHTKLKINSVEDLESAARKGKISSLKGFGEKTEAEILQAIERFRGAHSRFLLGFMLPVAKDVERQLKDHKSVLKISLAGSFRRRKETIGDLDILVTSQEPTKVMDFFTSLPNVKQVLAKGSTKSTVVLAEGIRADLRVVQKESYGAALQYFTGSQPHNIRLRELALERNWKLNEYGLFRRDNGTRIAGEDEESIYAALGLRYIEPELRENRGEIKAAAEGKLPRLVQYDEIRGDLHAHTTWSDGSHSLEEMAEAAESVGHEYLAICDHSKTLRIAHGMTEEDAKKQIHEIEKLNRKMSNITILSGMEVNIDSDGRLDMSNRILKDLDFVVASVHWGFKQSMRKMTDRVISAMHNDYADVIGHPTGRIIHKRDPYQIDILKIFEASASTGVCLEIDGFPDRLDLSDTNCFKARGYGVRVSLGSDAHSTDHLRYLELGVATARRGWLQKQDVINTLHLNELRKLLKS
jgi:DNA polymerase (family 10)